jgi:serine phosphatase RsbU (regulator of sigma subunit)/anti-sigma regulatory factor (Ser/Thr protein kinase)
VTADRRDQEIRITDALIGLGTRLNGETALAEVVQAATDLGTELTGAQFGAFFYNLVDEHGERYTLSTISGVDRSSFERFPLPRKTAVFAPTFSGDAIVRLDDVTADERYGRAEPYRGMPPGHLPVRSYLAAPVVSRTGGVLGGMFFGHADVGAFDEASERAVRGIAGQAAAAIDNARLHEREQRLAETLQRRLLPQRVPVVEGASVAVRYRPADDEARVGGDWYDVLDLGDGRLGVAIGDVVGHSTDAAAVMAQARSALVAYALDDHPPGELLRRVGRFLDGVAPDAFATCCYIELNTVEGTATVATAGHPPVIILPPDGPAAFADVDYGVPLGVDGAATYDETTFVLEPGTTLVLYTDGLVEAADVPLTAGMEALRVLVEASLGTDPGELANEILGRGPVSLAHHDDAALVVISLEGPSSRSGIGRQLPADLSSAQAARRFVADVLGEWTLLGLVDSAELLASELVTNAVVHTGEAVQIRLHRRGEGIRVEVIDGSGERQPELRDVGVDDTSGRGLFLVDALSSAWGIEPHGVGKAVWFELRPDEVDA